MRCPNCGNENAPEYPPDQYPFCMECGAQIGTFRPPPMQPNDYADPYRQAQVDPYGGPGPGPYGQPPMDPYGSPGPDPHRRPPMDPYADPRMDPYDRARADTPFLPPAAPAPGPARLILESGLGKIEYPLDSPITTIGRSRSNDISLEDSRVSRHHARIVHDERGFMIEDLNSRNGTRVDDRAVRDSSPLTDGAVVRIGDSVFRFTVAPPAGAQPHPSQGPGPFGAGAGPYGGGPPGASGGPRGGTAGPPAHGGPPVPEVFVAPWSPVQCPTCQGLKTMRPIVYGPAAQTPGAQTAARRGEVTLGEGPPHPGAPNAECRACGTRVRIVTAGS